MRKQVMNTEIKSPENSGKIQAKGKYKKGFSGNPKGKPKGARNKSTLAAEALLEGSLEKICKKIEEEALNGNMQAAKMILERFLPPRKDRCIEIDLPSIAHIRRCTQCHWIHCQCGRKRQDHPF